MPPLRSEVLFSLILAMTNPCEGLIPPGFLYIFIWRSLGELLSLIRQTPFVSVSAWPLEKSLPSAVSARVHPSWVSVVVPRVSQRTF